MSGSGSPMRRSGVRPIEQAVGEHRAGLGDDLHRRGHRDRADAVDPHAQRPPFARQALRQPALGCLHHPVRRQVRAALDAGGRRDAAAANPAARCRCGQRCLGAQVRRAHGGAHHRPQRLVGDLLDPERGPDGGERVVHHHVERRRTARPPPRPRRSRRRRTPTSQRSDSALPPRSTISPATTSPVSVRRAAMTTFAPCVAHARAMPRPTPPPAPVTRTVRPSSSRSAVVSQPHPEAAVGHERARGEEVRVRRSSSSRSSGARSAAGSPGTAERGLDSETARVSAAPDAVTEPEMRGDGDGVHGDPVRPPLAPAALGQDRAGPRRPWRASRTRRRRTCPTSGTTKTSDPPVGRSRSSAWRAVHHPASRARSQPAAQAASSRAANSAAASNAGRVPGVHELVDPGEFARSGAEGGGDLRFGLEAAGDGGGGPVRGLRQLRLPGWCQDGDAGAGQPCGQPVRQAAFPDDGDARAAGGLLVRH